MRSCHICGKSLSGRRRDFNHHLVKAHGLTQYMEQCRLCGVSFARTDTLHNHIRRKHPESAALLGVSMNTGSSQLQSNWNKQQLDSSSAGDPEPQPRIQQPTVTEAKASDQPEEEEEEIVMVESAASQWINHQQPDSVLPSLQKLTQNIGHY